ncbi:MAG: MBL fold metallo-hydrolase [Candidatus Cloacimonetes bacterium]|nr:MBL fold metallo-hydrolase [Candidatus Cloacimonadota bacterium]
MLTLKWYGHAMWSLITENFHIILDPYANIGYEMPKELTADIVISSHEHFDHNNFKLILPNFQKISQIGTYQLTHCKVKMIEASHGRVNEKNLGDTYLIHITFDGVTLLHCGDLGVVLNEDLLKEIGEVDILFIPVGGHFTINAEKAKEVIELLTPKFVFPMHYKTEKSTIDFIETIEPFAELYPNMEKINSNIFEISKEDLNKETQRILQLNYES